MERAHHCEYCGDGGADEEDWDSADWLRAEEEHREQVLACLEEAAKRHLSERGPLDTAELSRLLVRDGWDPEITDDFVDDGPATGTARLPDGRLALMESATDRTVLTRRLTPREIAADTIVDGPDLSALTEITGIRRTRHWGIAALADVFKLAPKWDAGGRLADLAEDSLVLARGSLARWTPGELVAVRIRRSGALRIARVPDPPAPVDLRPVLNEASMGRGYCELFPALWEQMWEGRLFRVPTLPVSELVHAAGYSLHAGWAVRDGAQLPWQ